jgi:NADPH-dependent curcumin reductase
MNLFLKRLTIHGFICSDPHLMAKYMPTFGKDMMTWLVEGNIKSKEEIVVGINKAPEAFMKMWKGEKFGKMVLNVDADDTPSRG